MKKRKDASRIFQNKYLTQIPTEQACVQTVATPDVAETQPEKTAEPKKPIPRFEKGFWVFAIAAILVVLIVFGLKLDMPEMLFAPLLAVCSSGVAGLIDLFSGKVKPGFGNWVFISLFYFLTTIVELGILLYILPIVLLQLVMGPGAFFALMVGGGGCLMYAIDVIFRIPVIEDRSMLNFGTFLIFFGGMVGGGTLFYITMTRYEKLENFFLNKVTSLFGTLKENIAKWLLPKISE